MFLSLLGGIVIWCFGKVFEILQEGLAKKIKE
jgi:hypothetical protein